MQISVPEAVLQMDTEETIFSEPVDTEDYHAMGIGPGLGTSEATAIALIAQLRRCTCPVVVDADALNILASHRAWMQQLPKNLIFTPHPRELDRLAGITSSNCTERLYKACELADRLHGYILLKGHFSALCHPDGKVEFCSTGNSGMATAGSGDVLTGIITALLARGYKQVDAARIGMYLHGLAGDLAIKDLGKGKPHRPAISSITCRRHSSDWKNKIGGCVISHSQIRPERAELLAQGIALGFENKYKKVALKGQKALKLKAFALSGRLYFLPTLPRAMPWARTFGLSARLWLP